MSAPAPHDPHRAVRRWLIAVYAMIFAMVLIGGVTRLTGSGLSMVEWRPLMGAIPPIGDAEWQATFDKYKESPQYRLVNHWMTVDDFARIFFWEYLHRLFGRLIGVVFFVPWLVFVVRRRLRGPLLRRTLLLFVLGGLQGLLGWFMVMSGLVDVPAVSHYRLAAHLSLAFLVALAVLWTALDLRPSRESTEGEGAVRRAGWWLLALLGLQVVYGAFMAGTRAGYLYATFPDMNGEMVPTGLLVGGASDLLDGHVTIHFVHRVLAYLVVVAAVALWRFAARRAETRAQRIAAHAFLATVLLQFLLGVFTVLLHVQVAVATAHQGGALLTMSAALAVVHAFRANPGRALDAA